MSDTAEAAAIRAVALASSLQARYDDPRLVIIEPCVNNEAVIKIGDPDSDPVYVDALDLLRLVSDVVLNQVYGPSLTEQEREER